MSGETCQRPDPVIGPAAKTDLKPMRIVYPAILALVFSAPLASAAYAQAVAAAEPAPSAAPQAAPTVPAMPVQGSMVAADNVQQLSEVELDSLLQAFLK